jgi:hypothetical protein
MNSFLSAIVSARPNRLTDTKDERYHLDFGKWAMMQGWSNAVRGEYIERIIRNEDFYRNFQWKTQEDIDTFLKDQSGQDRNRIMFTMNMIRQLVEQYRGHSLTMDINFRAENVSPFAKSRRDEKLSEMLFFTEQANRNSYFRDALKSRLMIGQDAQETTRLFNNAWIDELPLAVNALLTGVSKDNEFDEYIKMAMAEQMAFTGLGVVYDFCYAGKQKFNPILTKDFFWDLNARRYDLQDSEFMGYVEYLSAPQVLESTVMELNQEEKQTIENYDKSMGTSSFFNQGQQRSGMPVVNAFWRDTQSIWYGYVMNEYGYPQFVKINHKEEGEDTPRWTDKDLIDPPKNSRVIKQMRGRKKIRIDVDNIRFCRFVPWTKSKSYVMDEKPGLDIILDYGLLPYQDTMFEDYCNVRYPFKAWTWSYINGYVSSPIDDAINPQRFLNRVMSVTENQINNSGGAGVAYDEDMTELRSGCSEQHQPEQAAKGLHKGSRHTEHRRQVRRECWKKHVRYVQPDPGDAGYREQLHRHKRGDERRGARTRSVSRSYASITPAGQRYAGSVLSRSGDDFQAVLPVDREQRTKDIPRQRLPTL